MSGTNQDKIVRFLGDPANWPGAVGPVARIETHLSVVFLGGDRVLKLKRAVRFPYLDFSSVDKRRAACEAEVATNRRFAPGLYRGVVPVTRMRGGGLRLGGEGEAVDWLVDMARFEQDDVFDRKVLDRPLVESLVDAVAEFHAVAERSADHGGRDGLAWIIDSNRDCFRQWGAGVVEESEVDRVFGAIGGALDGVGPLLDARRAGGFVRHGHGDLHLGNVCLFQSRPTPFDAIEFNDILSHIDVLYDLAFPLMDLAYRGHPELANAAMNRYLDRTGDGGGIAALPLFMAVRAVVRSHVAAAEAGRKSGSARAEACRRARDYLSFAGICLEPSPPCVIAIGGLSGTGKTTLARLLAPLLGRPGGARIVRSDTLRKRLMGVSPETRLDASGYSRDVGARTYAALYAEVEAAARVGRTVIADAVFAKPDERAAIADSARSAGVPFFGFWLDTALDTRLARVSTRLLDASDADTAVAHAQQAYETGDIAWPRRDASGPPQNLALQIKKHLLAGS